MARENFPNVTRTYKSRARAVRVINGLLDGNYSWTICCAEDGRFFPHVQYSPKNCELSLHYFIDKGCCVTVEG